MNNDRKKELCDQRENMNNGGRKEERRGGRGVYIGRSNPLPSRSHRLKRFGPLPLEEEKLRRGRGSYQGRCHRQEVREKDRRRGSAVLSRKPSSFAYDGSATSQSHTKCVINAVFDDHFHAVTTVRIFHPSSQPPSASSPRPSSFNDIIDTSGDQPPTLTSSQ